MIHQIMVDTFNYIFPNYICMFVYMCISQSVKSHELIQKGWCRWCVDVIDGWRFIFGACFPSAQEFETGKPSLEHTAWSGMGTQKHTKTKNTYTRYGIIPAIMHAWADTLILCMVNTSKCLCTALFVPPNKVFLMFLGDILPNYLKTLLSFVFDHISSDYQW